jgi:hypothetical protein
MGECNPMPFYQGLGCRIEYLNDAKEMAIKRHVIGWVMGGVIIALPLVLFSVLTVLHPYAEETLFINRRTGKVILESRQFWLDVERFERSRLDPHLSNLGELTAPDIDIPIYATTFRTIFSQGTTQNFKSGDKLKLLCAELFFARASAYNQILAPLPPDPLNKLMLERLAIWNSNIPDNNTSDALAEKISEENRSFIESHAEK